MALYKYFYLLTCLLTYLICPFHNYKSATATADILMPALHHFMRILVESWLDTRGAN